MLLLACAPSDPIENAAMRAAGVEAGAAHPLAGVHGLAHCVLVLHDGQGAGQPEVGDLDHALLGRHLPGARVVRDTPQHQVRRLQIPVHDDVLAACRAASQVGRAAVDPVRERAARRVHVPGHPQGSWPNFNSQAKDSFPRFFFSSPKVYRHGSGAGRAQKLA